LSFAENLRTGAYLFAAGIIKPDMTGEKVFEAVAEQQARQPRHALGQLVELLEVGVLLGVVDNQAHAEHLEVLAQLRPESRQGSPHRRDVLGVQGAAQQRGERDGQLWRGHQRSWAEIVGAVRSEAAGSGRSTWKPNRMSGSLA
jgi:hypothetical protein